MPSAIYFFRLLSFLFILISVHFQLQAGIYPDSHADLQTQPPRFQILVISEDAGHHADFSKAAKIWLNQLAADSSFSIDYIRSAAPITGDYLSQYQLILQLDYPPYGWGKEAEKAFVQYIENGQGGWIGLHHASLLGEFDGYPMWEWFSRFMGEIRYQNYIADFVSGDVSVEDTVHPVMQGVPASFHIQKEEWYVYNQSPRPHVKVLASVDEDSYYPKTNIKMGDHPVIWSNEKYAARNLYIFMGHSPLLFENKAYKTLLKNAIFWAAGNY